MMTKNEQQIQESRRDALVALNLDAAPHLHNANDLYQEMLIDNQVSAQVMTSPVASATASIQQHINTLMLGMEPDGPSIMEEDVQQWNSIDSQYAIWSADQALLDTPEIYIEPTLRYDKSRYFIELEDALNSGQINEDTVQESILNYLGKFEAVSNLKIVSGYFDNSDMAEATYVLIGKTNSAPYRYYWRQLNMRQVPDGASRITADSWGDWEPIDIELEGTMVLSHTVRPMYYNNRLHLAWIERNTEIVYEEDGTSNNECWMRMSYLQFDDNWTPPATFVYLKVDSDFGPEEIDSQFFADVQRTPSVIAMFIKYHKGGGGGARGSCLSSTLGESDFDHLEDEEDSVRFLSWYNSFISRDHLQYTSFSEPDLSGDSMVAPLLCVNEDLGYGSASFIDFTHTVDLSDGNRLDVNGLGTQRLNTTFAEELIRRAYVSLPHLLSTETQLLSLEPSLNDPLVLEPIDFYGANGLYFWELFFHLPLLVANKMNTDQNYDEARQWLGYLFDPASQSDGDKPAYWNCVPIFPGAMGEASRLVTYVTDPDSLAYSEPEIYRKAVYLAYVRNLMDMGDGFYRQLTPDALNNAKLRYVQALDLLGEKPEVAVLSKWGRPTLGAWTEPSSIHGDLAGLEFQALDKNTLLALKSPCSPGVTTLFTMPSRALDGDEQASEFMSGGIFVSPLNKELLTVWTELETRLYNLRHNLTLDGKPLVMPLYATPMDPNELQANAAANGGTVDAGAGALMEVPHYRFKALLPTTLSSVETLRGYGQQLHGYLDSDDRLGQEELQYQQLMEMGQVNITLQQEALSMAEVGKEALLASRAVTEQRHQHYKTLYDRHLTSTEQRALSLAEAAKNMAISAGAMNVAMGAARMVPNIYGLATGGFDFGGLLEGTAKSLEISAGAMQQEVQYLERSESYQRRREEWQIQYQQAELEMATIDQQLIQQDIQITSAQTALSQAELQLTHHQQMYDYLLQRFTGRSLYQWLSSQLSTLYYQLYDATMARCLALQCAWQYEMGDFVSQYVPSSAWNDSYRGLLAGEQLRLALMRMEADYLKLNERRQEITKTISLKELVENSDNVVGCTTWEQVITALLDKGDVTFSFTTELFDGDYTGHYLRQLKWVSLSLPTLVGPYQDVRVTLTQTSNALDVDGNGTMKNNLRASQTVTYSHGIEDSGLFVLNPDDERYLPFEGTGAISTWQLAFPQGSTGDTGFGDLAESKRQAMLDALSDIIIHARYTAKQG